MRKLLSAIVILMAASFCGCVEKVAITRAKPFEVVELETSLGVLVDMSASYADSWGERAHRLFLRLMDELFRTGAGAECRVVIGQLSASEPVVIFEGRPNELRRKFKTPDSFNAFLKANSDPSSSKVYDSTRTMINYMSSLNGVTEDTRLITVILSDMQDSESDKAAWKASGDKMLASLKEYQKKGGGLALYFVAQDQTKLWREVMASAGFGLGEYVIETNLSESPQLPRLD